jgi:hypothetical protein
MDETTPLDLLHMEMEDAPDDEGARLRFYERLAAGELFVLTEGEAGETPAPQVFRLSDGPFVMAFDREDRLATFADAPAPYAALPGRALVRRLAGKGVGIGLNLGVAPSSFLMGADAVDWLAAALPAEPATATARPVEFAAPKGLPEALVAALDRRFAAAAGLALRAGVAAVTYQGGRRGHMAAFLDATPGAEAALAGAVAEALAFSGLEAGEIDVTFMGAEDPAAAAFQRVALMFELPAAAGPSAKRTPPGSDPEKPPRLR